jgi:hypothetical protein
VAALERAPGVEQVTADGTVRMKGRKWIDDGGINASVGSVKRAAGGKEANTTPVRVPGWR